MDNEKITYENLDDYLIGKNEFGKVDLISCPTRKSRGRLIELLQENLNGYFVSDLKSGVNPTSIDKVAILNDISVLKIMLNSYHKFIEEVK